MTMMMMKTLRKILNYLSFLLLLFLTIFIWMNHVTIEEKNEVISPSAPKLDDNQIVEWKVHSDGTVLHQGTKILDRNYTMIINNPDKCLQLQNDTVSFLIMILSGVMNFEQRQTIRDTWAIDLMQNLGNYKVFFMVGLTNSTDVQERLKFENLIYEDILQINIQDSFYNLTYKSITMLHWYINYCSNAKFLFKTDDDIYLHIPNVIKLLMRAKNITNQSNISNRDKQIVCRRNKAKKILRNANMKDLIFYSPLGAKIDKQLIERSRIKFRKYIVDSEQLPGILYPDYCSGYGYVMDYATAQHLFEASETIPYIGIEDVFITGFCRCKANISITNNDNFRLTPIIHPIESRCAFETGRINSNEMSTSDMKTLWTHVNTQGYYCKYKL